MKPGNARILIIGAGVNGSICAARLHRAGVNVKVLARGKRYVEVRDQGIIIEDVLKKTRDLTQVPVAAELETKDIYDYILVVVRKNQAPDLLPTLARNGTPNIVFMVNNPSGPEEWIRALGKERVLVGFVFGSGKRDGNVVRGITSITSRSLAGRLWPTPFGELDGAITPRLKRLVGIFRNAGLAAVVSTHVSDYVATHAALVAVIEAFVVPRGYDHESLAHYTVADIRLFVEAMREALEVLRADGVRVTPSIIGMLEVVPRWILVAAIRRILPSRFMEAGSMDLPQALDEMIQLVGEVRVLVEKSSLSVPEIRKLLGMNALGSDLGADAVTLR